MTLHVDPNLPPRLQFRQPKPYDRQEIRQLWTERTGLAIENTLDAVFDDDRAAYGILATDVEEIVGCGIVLVVPPPGIHEYFDVETDDYPVSEQNAILAAGVVQESWEGRGIGTELMRLRLELVQEFHEVGAAFGTAWLRPDTVDSSALFEKLGFARLETVENYYRRMEFERDCPDCEGTCTCSATIYGKAIASE